MGSTAADVSPYPPGHFHRRLAGTSARDLQSELGLRWVFALAHARQAGEPVHERCDSLILALLEDLRELPATLPPSYEGMAVTELVVLIGRFGGCFTARNRVGSRTGQ